MGGTGTPGDLVKIQVWAQRVWGGTQGFCISSRLQDAGDHTWRKKVAVMLAEEKEADIMESSPGQGLCWALPLLSFSCSVMSDCLQPHRLQHARLPCPSLSPRVCSSVCPLSWALRCSLPFHTLVRATCHSGRGTFIRLFAFPLLRKLSLQELRGISQT